MRRIRQWLVLKMLRSWRSSIITVWEPSRLCHRYFFRNQPLGCTATIIYQMYQEAGIKVEPKIAGLLCSAIVSDTLLFRSPTCTPVDEMAARALADIAGIDIEKYAMEMFSAGSNLKDKSDEEIFYQDFKRFTSGKVTIGVGQITSLNGGELDKLKGRMEAFMEKALENNGLNMIFFMLTNILTETTRLICEGQEPCSWQERHSTRILNC